MDLITIYKAVLLGIIEGLTEFLPVSSTAHLLLSSSYLDFSYIQNDVFEIFIQLGAIFAVCAFYHKKLFNVVFQILSNKSSQHLAISIIISFIPAAIIGFLFYGFIKVIFFNSFSIALALIIGGILILLIERMDIKPQTSSVEEVSYLQSFKIGLFQVIAMIPGISRSGATIMGGVLLKLDRKTATEFSFFLAIPTIFAASLFDLYQNYQLIDKSASILLAIGFITSFISSLIVIKWFIGFVSTHSFRIFAYYRIILGTIILFIS